VHIETFDGNENISSLVTSCVCFLTHVVTLWGVHSTS